MADRSTLDDSDSRRFWMPDSAVRSCHACDVAFSFFLRRHHCRLCGQIFCWKCSTCKVARRRARDLCWQEWKDVDRHASSRSKALEARSREKEQREEQQGRAHSGHTQTSAGQRAFSVAAGEGSKMDRLLLQNQFGWALCAGTVTTAQSQRQL